MKQQLIAFLSITLLLSSFNSIAQHPPLKIIFDTDFGPDYDDVGALTMLHAFADSKEVELLATIASTKYNGVASVLDAMNTYFNRPDLPIGVPTGNALALRDFQHWTDTLVARYPHSINSNDEAVDAVKLYRKILSSQPDHRVTIVSVGFLTNIAALLQSPPDEYSTLNGVELVERKVFRLVSMAGAFPSGQEWNVKMDAASANYVFKHFSRPILFSGVEIGFPIKTGLQLIHNNAISNSPVKDVYRICMTMTTEDANGRSSWDQTAVLVAVRGYAAWFTVCKGKITANAEGYNTWETRPKNQAYLIQRSDKITDVRTTIENLMMHQPKR